MASTALASALVVALGATIAATPAAATSTLVRPGQSIQAALDATPPGGNVKLAPGTYHESVGIIKDGVTLEGSGADVTIIEPAATPSGPCGSQGFGICIVGQLDESDNVTRPVRDVRVTRLSVRNFSTVDSAGQRHGTGIFVLGGDGATVDHVVVANNGSFGISSVASSGDRYLHDTASGSSEAGIQIAQAAGPGATLLHNRAFDNRFGILILASTGGLAADNQLTANCSGMTLTGGAFVGGAPTSGWALRYNDMSNNSRSCPAAGDGPHAEPAVSGNGIAVWGAKDIEVSHNTVNENRPSGPSEIAGGIVVISTLAGDIPTNITVTDNRIARNAPDDIVWDTTGSNNIFNKNRCTTSSPDRLCP